mgnify:CR=1 FL=1
MANRFLSNIKINDAYTFPASDGTNGQVITTDGAGNLSFQSAGEAGATVIYKDLFTGNASTVVFTLANSVDNEVKTQVYFDGVYQSKDNYSTSGSTVTFTTAPPNGAEIEVIHFVSVQGAIKVDSFTGDNSAVAFTTGASIIDEDNTQIYIDGVYQSKDNYTTSGNVITFSTAPGTGAIIEVVHIKAIDLSTIVGDQLTGNGSATAFTLSRSIDDENNTFVFINGVYQDKSTYSISGTTLTFSTAPQNGYAIEVMSFDSISIASTGVTSYNGSTGAVSSDYSISVINSATTAVKNTLYVFTGSAALTLPAGVVGNSIKISNRSATTTCTVLPNGTNKIMGSNTTMTLDDENASFELIYSGTAQGWVIIGQ